MVRMASPTVIPALEPESMGGWCGGNFSTTAYVAGPWIPAFAGMTVGAVGELGVGYFHNDGDVENRKGEIEQSVFQVNIV